MAGEHPSGDHPLHPRGRLTYAIAEIAGGPWPGRLALGPLPRSARDVAHIRAWDASLVLSLVEDAEAAQAGAGPLDRLFADAGLDCIRAPIADYQSPGIDFESAWPAYRRRALELLDAGGRVLTHCRGGRGRSGTIAAALLMAGGLSPDAAIGLVRNARPGAIETPEQEAWLMRQRGLTSLPR